MEHLVILGAAGAVLFLINRQPKRPGAPMRILDGPLTVTSPFGRRKHPVTGAIHEHSGVDLRAAIGSKVYAPEAGTVTRVEAAHPLNGHWLSLRSTDGQRSWAFAHLLRATVAVGDHVEPGAVIAHTGDSGRTTGPHLHVGLRVNGERVDPWPHITRDA